MLEQSLAYIDPVSGSIMIQLLVGAVLGGGLFFRRSIARLFGFFRGTSKDEPTDASSPSEQPTE